MQLPNVNDIPANANPFEGIGEFQPSVMSGVEDYEPVEAEEDEAKVLSSIVAKMWKKTSDYYDFNRSIGKVLVRPT
jgi:hypothetical protein